MEMKLEILKSEWSKLTLISNQSNMKVTIDITIVMNVVHLCGNRGKKYKSFNLISSQ